MSGEIYNGFLPTDITDIRYGLDIVEAEQDGIPSHMQGLPLNSAPIQLFFELNDMLQDLDKDILPPEVFDSEHQKLIRRIDLLEVIHDWHRQMMLSDTRKQSPQEALVNTKADVIHLMQRGIQPFTGSGWEESEYGPYVDAVIDSYLDFYQPTKNSITY